MPATLRLASPEKLQSQRRRGEWICGVLSGVGVLERFWSGQPYGASMTSQERKEQNAMMFRWISSGTRARVVVLAAAGALVAALVAVDTASAAPSAPPGGDAAYQVELSGNVPGKTGGGSWFWLELDKDGGGIHAGSDCAHGGGGA